MTDTERMDGEPRDGGGPLGNGELRVPNDGTADNRDMSEMLLDEGIGREELGDEHELTPDADILADPESHLGEGSSPE